jgi:hypothetical protein
MTASRVRGLLRAATLLVAASILIQGHQWYLWIPVALVVILRCRGSRS